MAWNAAKGSNMNLLFTFIWKAFLWLVLILSGVLMVGGGLCAIVLTFTGLGGSGGLRGLLLIAIGLMVACFFIYRACLRIISPPVTPDTPAKLPEAPQQEQQP